MNNEALIAQYKKEPKEELLESLIKNNDRLVWKIIKDYGNKYNDPQDSYQDAIEGFIEAVNSYKPDRNTKFSTWAYQQIRNYLQNNDFHYNHRERQIYKAINENPDKTLEEVWKLVKENPKNDVSKELFDLVAAKREIPIDKRVPDKDGNMMFIVDQYKSDVQDHSQLYFYDMLKTLNPRQEKIARLLLEENTHKYIKKALKLTDTVFNRELQTIQLKVKGRI